MVVAAEGKLPRTFQLDQRDTHRLIPAQYAEGGAPVLTRLTDDPDVLNGIFELDNATNDRLLAEKGMSRGIDPRELVFGIPSYRIINAAFCHPAVQGSRFNSSQRGAWYAAFELETSHAEMVYHKRLWLLETGWSGGEEIAAYVDYLADYRAEFHDIRESTDHSDCLSPDTYGPSQALADQLLKLGSSGVVYPSVRRSGGTCVACFRPVLVVNVRRGGTVTFVFSDPNTPPTIP
jgi:hypothetical protein